jgi:hypothetical protein
MTKRRSPRKPRKLGIGGQSYDPNAWNKSKSGGFWRYFLHDDLKWLTKTKLATISPCGRVITVESAADARLIDKIRTAP